MFAIFKNVQRLHYLSNYYCSRQIENLQASLLQKINDQNQNKGELIKDIEKFYSLCWIHGINPQSTHTSVLQYLEKHFQDFDNQQVVLVSILHPFFKNSLLTPISNKINQEDFLTLKQKVFLLKVLSFSLLGEFKDKQFKQDSLLNQLKQNLKGIGQNYTKEIIADKFLFSNFIATYYKFYQSENDLHLKEKQILWDGRNKILKEKTFGVIPIAFLPLENQIKSEFIPNMIDPIVTFKLLRNINAFTPQMIDSLSITDQLDFLLLSVKSRYPLDVNILKSIRKSCEKQLKEQKHQQLVYQQRWSLQLNLSHLAELGLSSSIPENSKQISLKQICDTIWSLTQNYHQEHESLVGQLISQVMPNLHQLHLNDLINLLYGTIIYSKFHTLNEIKGIFSFLKERLNVERVHTKPACLLYQLIRYLEILSGREAVSDFLDMHQYQELKNQWNKSRFNLKPQESPTEVFLVNQILTSPPLQNFKYTKNAYVQNLYFVDILFPAQKKLKNNLIIEIDSDLHQTKIYNPLTRQFDSSYSNGTSKLRSMILHRCKYQIITFNHTEYLNVIDKSSELQKLVVSKLSHIYDQQ